MNRHFRNFTAFCFGLALAAAMFLCAPEPAHAQLTGSSLTAMNNIIANTPGVGFVFSPTPGTGMASATAAESGVFRGIRVPFMPTATVGVTAGRVAGIAAGVMRAGTAIGIASIVLPWILDQNNLHVCPPPDFICKDVPNVAGYMWKNSLAPTKYFDTPDGACQIGWLNRDVASFAGETGASLTGNTCFSIPHRYQVGNQSQVPVCPNGQPSNINTGCGSAPTVTVPASDVDITSRLEPAITNDPSKWKTVYGALRQANVDVIQGGDPATVKAPQVSLPTTTTTTQVQNPDGTTSTKVVVSNTQFTPTQQGTTVADTKLAYPAHTITQTQITNNTTNVTTTTVEYFDEYAQPDVAQKLDLPTDYNRENTQLAIKDQLTAAGAPEMAPQGPIVDSAVAKSSADMGNIATAVQNDQTTDKAKIFSWVWTPPVGTCAAFAGTVHGNAVSWDICPTVNNIRDVLGWLMSLFGLIEIYSQLTKKGD